MSDICPACNAPIGEERILDEWGATGCCAGCLALVELEGRRIQCGGDIVRQLIASIRPRDLGSLASAITRYGAPSYANLIPEVIAALDLESGVRVAQRGDSPIVYGLDLEAGGAPSAGARHSVIGDRLLFVVAPVDSSSTTTLRVPIPEGGAFLLQQFGKIAVETGSVFLLDRVTPYGYVILRKPDCPEMSSNVNGWDDVRFVVTMLDFLDSA